MAVQNRDQIGWLHCPMCQTRATVHQCKIGRGGRKAAKYYRCECGGIQPYKDAGQRFIEANFEPLAPVDNQPVKPSEPAPAPEIKPQPETAAEFDPGAPDTAPNTEDKPQRRGFFASLFDDEE